MKTSVIRPARILLAISLALAVVGCGTSVAIEPGELSAGDSAAAPATATSAATPTPVPAPDTAADVATDATDAATEAAEPAADAAADETEPQEQVADPTSNGTVEIAFADGRSWSLDTVDCYTDPDSSFGIFFMAGVNDDGADFGAVESWPLDGDRSGGTAFIATFVDETGAVFIIEGGPVTENGESLSFSSAVYEGLAVEPSTTGTFSCTP